MFGNPLQLMQMIRGGANSDFLYNQAMSQIQAQAGRSPQMAQMLQAVKGKSPAEVEQLARNLYNSNGRDYNSSIQQIRQQIRQQIGI